MASGDSYYCLGKEELLTCPYNNIHRISQKRYIYHMQKCRAEYLCRPDKVMKVCEYHAAHIIPECEYPDHVKKCPYRNYLERDFHKLCVGGGEKQPSCDQKPASVANTDEEDWDAPPTEKPRRSNPAVHLTPSATNFSLPSHCFVDVKTMKKEQKKRVYEKLYQDFIQGRNVSSSSASSVADKQARGVKAQLNNLPEPEVASGYPTGKVVADRNASESDLPPSTNDICDGGPSLPINWNLLGDLVPGATPLPTGQ